MITSPNVKHVVQQHFGCSSLRGAEFEDDGASGTVNSHWEERIFQVRVDYLHWHGVAMFMCKQQHALATNSVGTTTITSYFLA